MNRNTMNSREFYGLYNTRDFNKGKSFRISTWHEDGHYFNDEYIQDFVSHQGSLYFCIETNIGVIPTDTDYWTYVMSGQEGRKGETGTLFTPFIDSDGNLSWSNPDGLQNPLTQNIKGPKGDLGPKGDSITKMYVADDGYLYILLSNEVRPRRVGYVRGDKGNDGREIVLRVDEDSGTPGVITHLQWKYAGDEYKLWHNLINLTELIKIYDVTHDGGLGLTNDNNFYIKDEGVVERMLSEDLHDYIYRDLYWTGTQAEYDAITNKTPDLLYFITD